jgi:ech hydrogenase subunit F
MSFFTMAGTTLANLFRKPATRMYPAAGRTYPDTTRGHVEIDVAQCVFCGLCVKNCPTTAISVQRNTKTWSIERLRCIACGSCCEACPKDCLLMGGLYSSPVTSEERDTAREVIRGA